MNILIYQPRVSYYTGGGEVVPIKQAIYLADLGHEITFVTTKGSFLKKTELLESLINTKGITIKYIEVPSKYRWIYKTAPGENWERWDLESLQIGLLAKEHIQKLEYDLGVAHLLIDRIALKEDKKNIVHLHGFPSKFQYHHELFAILNSHYISVSNKVADVWSSILPKDSKNYVVKNGVDTKEFIPNDTKKTTDLLFIGRLIKVKGVDVIINAISLLNDPTIRLDICGIGPEHSELEKLVIEKKLSKQITFSGYVNQRELVKKYNSTKIAVFPSIGKEGVLTTMLEAASCGLPIITTDAGSMSEFIENNVTGILTKPNDAVDLSKQIKKLLRDQVLREKMGKNARQQIMKAWSWNKKIKELEKVYKEVING